MQTRSSRRAVATPRQPQSIAALLPEEIVDLVIAQFGYDYSMDASESDRRERYSNLSDVSVVAEGWTNPARRLLVKSVKVETWAHLRETVPGWAGKQVRELHINARQWNRPNKGVASAVFKLLKQLPTLRRLRLNNLRFDSFNPTDSASMQSTILLPYLHDLSIYGDFASPIIFDLLATSNHQISRLGLTRSPLGTDLRAERPQLDFRGNLRYLSADEESYQTLLDPTRVILDGLAGVEVLDLLDVYGVSSERDRELLRVVAPTLRTLSIHSRKASWLKDTDVPFPQLSRLNIYNRNINLAPFFNCLPPTLSSLHFSDDRLFEFLFALWTANPALVPASLKSIGFNTIYNINTFAQLPRIQTLFTRCADDTVGVLGRLSPGTLPFTTLEIWFPDYQLDKLSVVQAECARLGVEFRQRSKH